MTAPDAQTSGTQAQAAKDEAMDRAQDVKDSAMAHAGAVAQETKTKASNVAGDVRRELETQGDAQAKRLASALHGAGRQLSSMAVDAEPGTLTDMTRQLAGGTERWASRLEESGVQGVGDDLRSFARRQPGLFLAAAGVTGFVVTRALRNATVDGE
jgi:hypothetical protein